jgi:hypothetical protein
VTLAQALSKIKHHQPSEFYSDDPKHPGFIYLLHFKEPFGHARHYMGYASRTTLASRIGAHGTSSGSNLMRYVAEAGIEWVVARVYVGSRDEERRLKDVGGRRSKCPVCSERITYEDAELLTEVILDV